MIKTLDIRVFAATQTNALKTIGFCNKEISIRKNDAIAAYFLSCPV